MTLNPTRLHNLHYVSVRFYKPYFLLLFIILGLKFSEYDAGAAANSVHLFSATPANVPNAGNGPVHSSLLSLMLKASSILKYRPSALCAEAIMAELCKSDLSRPTTHMALHV